MARINTNNSSSRRKTEKSSRSNPYFSALVKLTLTLVAIYLCVSIGKYALKKYIYPLKYMDSVQVAANNNNVDPYLVLSIIKVESGFNENAVSAKEARGLMQIMDSTAQDINDKNNLSDPDNLNLHDVDINIRLGTTYFASLINRYGGNYYLAICAYNAGMGNVDKWLNQGIIDRKLDESSNVNIPFKETKNYLEKVINTYKMYKMLYG